MLEKVRRGFGKVVVLTDILSKYRVAVATRAPKVTTVAKVLLGRWFL